MKKLSVLLALLLAFTNTQAQETETEKDVEKPEAYVSAQLISHYTWRGLDMGDVSIQPTIGVSYKGFSAEVNGNAGWQEYDPLEFDITLAYSIGGLRLAITDYWATPNSENLPYFNYKSGETWHTFEGTVGYDFGFLSATWNTNFAGLDGSNNSSDRAFSSYFELSAPFRFGGCDWQATLGIVPWATSYYLTERFAVTNASLRATYTFHLNKRLKLPIFAELSTSPYHDHAFLIFGVAIGN